MGGLHQHPDGRVFVNSGDGSYGDTMQNFTLDSGVELPALPPGANERIYEQDVRHAITGGSNLIEGGPVPWDMGDAIIASVLRLVATKRVREDAVVAAERAAKAIADAAIAAQQAEAAAVIEAKNAPTVERKNAILATPDTASLISRLKTATPAQIDTWVDGNVTNLAEARNVLKAIVKIIATQIS